MWVNLARATTLCASARAVAVTKVALPGHLGALADEVVRLVGPAPNRRIVVLPGWRLLAFVGGTCPCLGGGGWPHPNYARTPRRASGTAQAPIAAVAQTGTASTTNPLGR